MMNRLIKITFTIVWIAALVLAVPSVTRTEADVSARSTGQCPAIVQQALDLTEQGCGGTGRNEACYGHTALDAEPQPDAQQFTFTQEGDRVDVVEMQSLRLGPMDEAAGTWGVALLRLQTSLPDSAPDNVTVVLFGDVALTNTAAELSTLPALASSDYNVNVRTYPNSNAPILSTVLPGTRVTANGRVTNGSWLRVSLPDSAEGGWMRANLLTVDGDPATLSVVDPESRAYGPMQAFTFKSGLDDAPCTEAPQSGMVIQTPHGMGRITFLINEVDVQLGSTVFFQAAPGQRMIVRVIEGSAHVTVGGTSYTALAGTYIDVPLDNNGSPAGPPNPARPYEMGDVQMLPVNLLPREVAVREPMTAEEFALAYALDGTVSADPGITDGPGNNGQGNANGGNPSQGELPPGLVDNPGLGDTLPPGLVDNPGQDDTLPPGLIDNPGLGDTLPPGHDGDLPPGLIDNPGLGDNLPPGHGGAPPGQSKKDD